jgi:hypothetical protein
MHNKQEWPSQIETATPVFASLWYMSGFSSEKSVEIPRESRSVDRTNSEDCKTPDRKLICRALAQDGDPNSREMAHLSTKRLPETKKYPTVTLSVGHQPRTVIRTVERKQIC